MASPALEVPAGSFNVQRDVQADRSFARRALLATFVAACGAALVTLVAVDLALRAEVKAGVIHSLRETQRSLEQARAVRNQQDNKALAWMSLNPVLRVAIVRAEQTHGASRRRALQSIQKFARSVRDVMQGDVAAVTTADGRLLATAPTTGSAALLFRGVFVPPGTGGSDPGRNLHSVVNAPVRAHGRQIGALSVAVRFTLASLRGRGFLALLHSGRVVRSSFPAGSLVPGLQPDCIHAGCELRMNGEDFLVTPVSRAAAGAGLAADDQLFAFQSIDAAMEPMMSGFRTRLPGLGVAGALLALCLAAPVSHALSRPLRQLAARLERSQASGGWKADFPEDSTTREVNLLAAAINRAAVAVADSNERLDQATVEFVEGMAQALDARDPCTAGHSRRVSEYASAIAITMGLSPDEIETVRQGARLHDIGKIGISDIVLRKPGELTPEEYEMIKLHPQIGRKILECVPAFERYLPFVELHHEDFDGQGYPHGLKGHEVPLAVRIVRVADVFDALTNDRSYRQAIALHCACQLIESHAGVKFDPDVVRALRAVLGNPGPVEMNAPDSLARLALS